MKASPENSGSNQALRVVGGKFAPGQSGNPRGKPIGARHRATRLVEDLIQGDAEKLERKMVDLALAGDTAALRWALDRIAPRPRHVASEIKLRAISGPTDAAWAVADIFAAVSRGDISPREAAEFVNAIASAVRVFESASLEARLNAIEQKLADAP